MKQGSIVECQAGGVWWNTKTMMCEPGPALKEISVVDGFFNDNYIYLQEYNYLSSDGTRLSYNKEYFREIQPPMVINIEQYISETV